MKHFFSLLIVFFLLTFINISTADAHLAGQPPFFEINGKLAAQYNVPSTSLDDFSLPQDIGIDRYLVNVPIQFTIKAEILGVPEDIASQTNFVWDYGDGTKGEGLENKHTYKKPGSYTIAIDAVYKNEPVLIESSMIQVLPTADYKLPVAVMYVNDKTAKDPLVNIITLPFFKSLHFDASKSETGSVKIVSYRWDFGDGNQDTQVALEHTYKLDSDMVFPVLRVVDENGFMSDTFMQINKTPPGFVEPTPVGSESSSTKTSPAVVFGGVLVIFGLAGISLYLYKKKAPK